MQDGDADSQQVVVVGVAGVADEPRIDLLRNDQDDATPRTAAERKRVSSVSLGTK
jgi:hypothetical protein